MSNNKRVRIAAALVLAAGLTTVAMAAHASSSGSAVVPPVVGGPAVAPAVTVQDGKTVSVPGQSEHSGTPGYQTRDTVIPDGATPEEIQQLLNRPW